MALTQTGAPNHAFSADFDLRGDARAGSLVLSTPLGTTLAHMQWDAASASLQTTGAPQPFDSLESLVRHTTGTDLPVASLFAWLQGQPAAPTDWQADLSHLNEGRLTVRRLSLVNPAELRIILDR